MVEFKEFDSFEDAQSYMRAQEATANAGLHPKQIEARDRVGETVYWVRPAPEVGCLIFGSAYSFKESCEESAKSVPNFRHVDPEEWEEAVAEAVFEIRSLSESRPRGYLYGWAWSQVEPRGDLGSTHVANLWPITEKAFREARNTGWRAVRSAVPGVGTPTLNAELEALDSERQAWVREART